MKNLKNKIKSMKGITLISLVVTIIVLIILAGVAISVLLGDNGLIARTNTAKDENEKSTAIETMNLKITNVQISKYAEEQRMPTLKELADNFCEDDDFQYVQETSEVASLTKITSNNPTSIYTKLKAYPYEFEINSSLQLASIDGVKVASNETPSTEYVKKSDYDALLARVVALENNSSSQSGSSVSSDNYSTTEQEVGTWIDEEKIYERVLLVSGTWYGYDPIIYDLSSWNIDKVITIDGYNNYSSNHGVNSNLNYGHPNSTEWGNCFYIDPELKIRGCAGSKTSVIDPMFIIRYTKNSNNN